MLPVALPDPGRCKSPRRVGQRLRRGLGQSRLHVHRQPIEEPAWCNPHLSIDAAVILLGSSLLFVGVPVEQRRGFRRDGYRNRPVRPCELADLGHNPM